MAAVARLQQAKGTSWLLPTRCILGRSRACTIRLAEPEVSGEHALIRWNGGAWELQDLHSRNGTYVDGRAIGSGQRVGLSPGAVIGFGRPDGYVLGEADAPQPFAIRVGDGFVGLWDDVPSITMPTTLVRGAKSYFVHDDDAAAFAAGAPGFQRTHVVPDSGHSVQGDQPAALVEILRGVLGG